MKNTPKHKVCPVSFATTLRKSWKKMQKIQISNIYSK